MPSHNSAAQTTGASSRRYHGTGRLRARVRVQLQQARDAFPERGAEAAAVHAEPAGERGTAQFLRAGEQAFGEAVGTVGDEQAGFIGNQFAGVIEFAPGPATPADATTTRRR